MTDILTPQQTDREAGIDWHLSSDDLNALLAHHAQQARLEEVAARLRSLKNAPTASNVRGGPHTAFAIRKGEAA